LKITKVHKVDTANKNSVLLPTVLTLFHFLIN